MRFLTDPWSWWIEPFVENPFLQRSLWAGLLTVLATSVIGTWVVLRGMSFLGDALAHGVLPGVAIAVALGGSPTVGAFVAALVMVGGVQVLRGTSPLPEDTSIGVLFVGFLALAVVIMSADSESYFRDLNRFLFGSINGVTDDDLVRQSVAAAVVLAGVVIGHRPFLALTFDETQARLLGMHPKAANLGLLALLTVAVVSSFETVGNLLVFAFLVAPPAAASLVVRRVPHIMATSVVLGSIAVVVGLAVSYHERTAAAATMALVAVILYLLAVVANTLRVASGRRGTLAPSRLETAEGHQLP